MCQSIRNKADYLISDVSQQVGLSQKRIREYEKGGLIKPRRETRTNNRLYSQTDIRQIIRIKELIHEHGFTLACLRFFLTSAPCWIIFDCKKKENCPSYHSPHTPCYEIINSNNLEPITNCHSCPVYLNRNTDRITLLSKQ